MQTSEAMLLASALVGGGGVQAVEPHAGVPLSQGRRSLRLLVPQRAPKGTIALLRRAPVLVQHARSQGAVRRVDSFYYDTEDRLLFASRMSLQVRRHGRKFVQTLRTLAARGQAWPDQDPTIREAPLAGAAPDPLLFADVEALAPLLEHLPAAGLVKLFETRVRRQILRLDLPEAQVDVLFEEGVIEAAAGQQPLRDISLLLQSGEASALYDIALRLLEVAPLQVGHPCMVRRGFALASGIALQAEKAAPSNLTPGFAVDDMIAAVLDGCQSHLLANQAVAGEARRPEGVHQMRVALRRMRSAFSLLHRELPLATMRSLGAEAKWAAGLLGPARGWDVFLMTTLAGPEQIASACSDFAGLRAVSEAPRAAGYAAVQDLLDASRYTAFQLSLGRWIARRSWRNEVDRDGLGVLAQPASAMAVRVLARLQRRACRQGAHFGQLSAGGRHELRITLKKLRYATEFFLPLFAEPAQVLRYLRRLSSLQEALGLDHDAATTRPLLDELGQLSRSPGVHQAIGVVAGWQARDGLAAAATLAERWQRFKALPPFWAKVKLPSS